MGNLKKKKIRITRYYAACKKMEVSYYSEPDFVVAAMNWLAKKWNDLHVEFVHNNWCVRVTYWVEGGGWEEPTWEGDGSVASALLVAVEKTNI